MATCPGGYDRWVISDANRSTKPLENRSVCFWTGPTLTDIIVEIDDYLNLLIGHFLDFGLDARPESRCVPRVERATATILSTFFPSNRRSLALASLSSLIPRTSPCGRPDSPAPPVSSVVQTISLPTPAVLGLVRDPISV